MKKSIQIFLLLVTGNSIAQSSGLSVADSLYALGNYTGAINEYAKDNRANSNLQIARAYNAIGNYDKAIIQYEDVIANNPSFELPRFELGKLLLKTNKTQEAVYQFYDLIQEGSRNPEYYYYMGTTMIELDSFKEGIQFLKTAYNLDNEHLRSIFQLGKYYVGQQEKDSVLLYVDKGLDFYPNDVSLINLKALAMFNNDEYEKARILFEKLLDLGEGKPYIYEKLGQCYYRLWEFEKAKDAYNVLLNFDESIPTAYNGLGSVYWKEQKLDSAALFFKKAIKAKKPVLAGEYFALAGLAREQNDLKAALNYYQLAFEEDDTNYMVYYQICTLVDQLYEDPKVKLNQYSSFLEKFGDKKPYFSDVVAKRISELKEEMHFASE